MPRVSVVIPCYNHGNTLLRAIESVQRQTYEDWEIIIVDDGSTDSTFEIASGVISNSKKISYLRQNNAGVSSARNNGISSAKGEYILLLDADDWLGVECLMEVITYMDAHPDCTIFYPKLKWINVESGLSGIQPQYSTYRNMLLFGQYCAQAFRKPDWVRVGGFDETMKFGAEDWDFCIRMLYGNKNAHTSENVLYFYEIKSSLGSVSSLASKNLDLVLGYIYQKNYNIYYEYFGNPIKLARYKDDHLWADRKLPQLARTFQLLYQKVINFYICKK